MIFSNNEQEFLKRQRLYAAEFEKKFSKHNVPPFSWGGNLWGGNKNNEESLRQVVSNWQSSPDNFLNFSNYELPNIKQYNDFLTINSVLKMDDGAKVFYSRMSKNRSGYKRAIILVPQWNPILARHKINTNFCQKTFLPISTFLFFPSYNNKIVGVQGSDPYEVVSPSLGLTMFRIQQDVLMLQSLANYLHSELGFEKVGLFTYSIGSLRGFLAMLFAPELFDYGVLHFVADDFAKAVLIGLSTKHVAEQIIKVVSAETLSELWSVISPGFYESHLPVLKNKLRLVQARYDLAFGQDNVLNFTNRVRNNLPKAEIEEGFYGHYFTRREAWLGLCMLIRDFNFIYRRTGLKYI